MEAKSITGKSISEIKEAFYKCQTGDFTPTLAIIILNRIEDEEQLRLIFRSHNIAIFGTTAPKKFSENGLIEDDILVMLLDIKKENFKIILTEYKGISEYEAGYKAGLAGKNAFANPGFIISPMNFKVSGDELIRGLTDAAGHEVLVAGGNAGNPSDFSGVIFSNDVSSTEGLLALIINQDEVSMSGMAVSGWKPVGTTKNITRSEGSWVFTIDNEPAMKVIQRYLGDEMVASSAQSEGLLPSDLGYPLQIERESGNPIMNPVLFFNAIDQSIMMGGAVKDGDKFRFSLPPDFDVIDKVIESTRVVKEKEMADCDVLIVFSCVGRLGSFGPLISSEIEGMASTWGKPMIGYFSLGEFGKLDEERCEFQGTTVSWVALREKQ